MSIPNAEAILAQSISGFHIYELTDTPEVSFAGEALCTLLGADADTLCKTYRDMVHPSDRESFDAFLSGLKNGRKSGSAEYRLQKPSGEIVYVKDTVTVKKQPDGRLLGFSTLSDITEIKTENDNLRFLNETIPCGFLKYTCEKQPRITYINGKMKEFLGFPETASAEAECLEMYKDNIFLMVPMEERRRFSLYLNRVYSAGVPIAGDMTLLRCDGTKVYVFGWVTKSVNEKGEEEFQSACMDVTERRRLTGERETKRYVKALTDIYDKVFKCDLSADTISCLSSGDSPMFKWSENIPMQFTEATNRWIDETVAEEDAGRLKAFFEDFRQKRLYTPDTKPPQITYRARSSLGEMRAYTGVFLKMNETVSFYCCRRSETSNDADDLRNENVSLKEGMQELVMRFKEGIAGFEIKGEYVTPLYASENIREYFGFSGEEWMSVMEKGMLIKDFVSGSAAAFEDFAELLRTGEAEFGYFDHTQGCQRRMRAICSPKSHTASPRYVLLYNVDEGEALSGRPERKSVSVRTFGYFDVFVDGRAIAFRNQKSKELFALLTDRRGGFVSSQEAIAFLWEDEPVNSVTLARYRKVALRLKNILEEYGIPDVIESVDGKRRIVPERVSCDLFDYLTGKEEFSGLFKGSYLTNYSWAETTLAELSGNMIY